MQAEPRAQRVLLDIARLDSQSAQLAHAKQSLPQLAELNQLNRQRAALSERIVAAETRVSDAQVELDRIQEDVNTAQARRDRNQQTIDAGQVAAKTLTSLIEENEHLAGRLNKLEDDQLIAIDEVESLTAALNGVRQQRAEIEDQMRELLAVVKQDGGKLDAQIAEAKQECEQLAAEVPAELAQLYAKISERIGAAGAAELRQGRCGGCGIQLDVAEQQRANSAPADEILRCEQCGRILVRA